MQEEENINFEPMNSLGSPPLIRVDEKLYLNLFDEIEEKCNPDLFINSDNRLFDAATSIYGELMTKRGSCDHDLVYLRNRAINELGIHFSTRAKCKHLMQYFDPRVYTAMEPFDAERVTEAKRYYDRMQAVKDDIRALEQLEFEAAEFVQRRQKEMAAEAKKKELNSEMKRKEDEQAEFIRKIDRVAKIIFIVTFIMFIIVLLGNLIDKWIS